MNRVHPSELITPSRLDVFSKIDLARSILGGFQSSWAQAIFEEYLLARNPTGKFSENGTKFSTKDYVVEFQKICSSLKTEGFLDRLSKIPITTRGIENGAHRLAASLVLNSEVVTQPSAKLPQIYDYKHLEKIGLPSIYSDSMAFNYLTFKGTTRALMLTGMTAVEIKEVIARISKKLELVYVKTVDLTPIGQRRLVSLAYDFNPWWEDKFVETMAWERFHTGPSSAALILFEPGSEDLRKIKEDLRGSVIPNEFERKIHGTDFFSDTLTLGEVFLNRNSLDFINQSPIGSESRLLPQIQELKKTMVTKHINDWAVDGSAVLEIYGIRKAQDVDYVVHGDQLLPRLKGFDLHNGEYSKYPFSVSDVVFDPRLHMIYKGVKYLSLSAVLFQKTYNGTLKNFEDANRIVNALLNASPTYREPSSQVRARRWKLEIVLLSTLESVVSRLPRNIQIRVRRCLSSARKAVKYFLEKIASLIRRMI